MKATLQAPKSFGSAASSTTAQRKAGLKTIADNRPSAIAQRKLQGVVQGKGVVQRTEAEAIGRANDYLTSRASTWQEVHAKKHEMTSEQWAEVVNEYNRNNNGVRLRFVYNELPAPTSRIMRGQTNVSTSFTQVIGQAVSGLGYVEMGQTVIDRTTGIFENGVTDMLHSIAPGVTAASSLRSANSQAQEAVQEINNSNLLGGVRHAVCAFAFGVKGLLSLFTGGGDPVSIAATAVAHLMKSPEYIALANESYDSRAKYLINTTNALISQAPEDKRNALRQAIKARIFDALD